MSGSDKRMMALWLRFLTEIDEQTTVVPKEMLNSEEIKEALGIVERSVYTDAQILAYDKFWQDVDYANHYDPDYHFGLGKKNGIEEEKIRTAKKMRQKGMSSEDIADITGLPKEEIERL